MNPRSHPSPPTNPSWMQSSRPHQSMGPSFAVNDWVRATTPDGKLYWFSPSTKETRWMDPSLVAMKTEATQSQATTTTLSTAATSTTSIPSNNHLAQSTSSNATGKVESNAKPLWREVKTADGKVYYYNRLTKKTQWKRPSDLTATSQPVNRVEASGTQSTFSNSASNITATKSAAKPTTTKNSVYNLEAGVGAARKPVSAYDSTLPPGWKSLRTDAGRVYYYHSATKATSWTPPPFASTEDQARYDSTGTSHGPHHVLPAKRPASDIAPNVPPLLSQPINHQAPASKPHERLQSYSQLSKSQQAQSTVSSAQVQDADLLKAGVMPQATEKVKQQPESKWNQHETAEGRMYYHNPATNETSWTRPKVNDSATSKITPQSPSSPKQKRARTTIPVALYPNIEENEERTKNKSGAGRNNLHTIPRPTDREGNPLSDRLADRFFITRAVLRREIIRSKKRAQQSKQSNEGEPESHSDVCMISKDAPIKERREAFCNLLDEHGFNHDSKLLHVMSKCADDPRYTLLKTHEQRKAAWQIFREKKLSASKRQDICDIRGKKTNFIKLLHQLFDEEPREVKSLQKCRPEAIEAMKADQRYRALDDGDKTSLLRVYFNGRARKEQAERKKRKAEALEHMSAALMERIDPLLFPTSKEEEPILHPGIEKKDSIKAENQITDETKGDGSSFKKTSEKDKNPVQYFSLRTPYRELEAFLLTLSGADLMNKDDFNRLIRSHRDYVDDMVEKKKAREREARKRMQHDNRVQFRNGILDMLLQGKLHFASRWKDAAEIVEKEKFAKPEPDLGQRPSKLFEDGHDMFEERVQAERDKFKQLLKDHNVEVTNETTVDELVKKSTSIETFVTNIERPIMEALLVDRQRKEQKKRMKERDKLTIEFDRKLRESELGNNSVLSETVTMEKVKEKWKEDTVYKQLVALAGEKGITVVVDEFLRWKVKEERKKRKQDMEREQHQLRMDGNDRKRMRMSHGGFSQQQTTLAGAGAQEEENGWTAAVSKVSMTEEEKLAEKERRKREILKSAQ